MFVGPEGGIREMYAFLPVSLRVTDAQPEPFLPSTAKKPASKYDVI